MKVLKKNKGFTLVELIVVIAIIGILAAVLIPAITGYIKNARVSSDEQEARAIHDVYKTYVIEIEEAGYNGSFASYYNTITGKVLSAGWKTYKGQYSTNQLNEVNVADDYTTGGVVDYMRIVDDTSYFVFEGSYFTLINAKTGEIIHSGVDSASAWLQQ